MGLSPAAILYDLAGNAIKSVQDGADYLLGVAAKIRNAAGTVVNPATEDTLAGVATETKLEAVRALLATIDADTGHLNVDLSTIATETKLEAVRALLATIDADTSNLDVALSTRATEATLATADGRLTTIDAVLDSIKDTDGIKKIVDALPIGDNIIGRVKVTDGSSVAAVQTIDGVEHLAAGKANILDSSNSSVAQLAPAAEFAPSGTDVSQFASVAITVHSDKDSAVDGMAFEFSQDGTNWDDVYPFNLAAASSQTRRFQFPVCARYFRVHYTNGATLTTQFRVQTILQRNNILTSIHRIEDVVKEDRSAQIVKAAIIAQREGAVIQNFHPVLADVSGNLKVTTVGSDIPSDPSAFVLRYLLNGTSHDMRVDGSTTPVNFQIGPTVTNDVWSIRELLLTFTADDFNFDGLSFGPNLAMTNGFSVQVVRGGTPVEVFVVKQNEDFLRVPGRTPLVNNTGPKDVLGAALSFQGLVLNQANGDVVRITIRDDLTSVKFKFLAATLFAVKVL